MDQYHVRRIFARVGGKGPPPLLLHGFSETHVMWHRVAPQLADSFTPIMADLPGYGGADMPESDSNHTPTPSARWRRPWWRLWKRSAMCILRWPAMIAAVAPRIGRRPIIRGRLSQLAVLDILPTYDYWARMDRLYALKIYHWSFLRTFPLPKTYRGNPDFFLKQKMASQTKSKNLEAFDPRAMEHYLAAFRDPSRLHAMCEDYRARAYADFEIDKADS